jgi:hypothetical protein
MNDIIPEHKSIIRPMDKKTIINAIKKRIPEMKKASLVCIDEAGDKYNLVLVCELMDETAILIEDDFNMFMRHKDLLNIIDKFSEEIKKRKSKQITNKLPEDFFRNAGYNSFRPFA